MLQGSASATLSAKQSSVTAKVYATYDVTANDFSPSVSVGGTWKNNPTDASDRLTLQKAENEVMLAQLAYTSARDEYASNAAQLQSDIASWKLQYTLLKQTIAYDQNLLEQQKTLFAKGLATQQQVDDAAFTVDQDAYTLQTTLLEGLILENRIRTMQI
jgi:outer membrane protein TolC